MSDGIAVTAPDGSTVNFPAGTDHDTINKVMGDYHTQNMSVATPPAPAPIVGSRANFMDAVGSAGAAGALPPQVGAPDATPQANQSLLYSGAMGLRDPLDAAAQLAAHTGAALPSGPIQKFFAGQIPEVEKARQAAEQSYKQNSSMSGMAFDPARAAGNVLATAPIAYAMPGAAATKFLPNALSGTASGAVASALQPANESADFWKQKASQVAEGALSGGASNLALGALGRIVSPNTSEAAQKLMGAGITPTPGQIIGGGLGKAEEKLQSLPIIGDQISAARYRAVQDLNRSAINNALLPIGQQLGKDTPLGHQAIQEAADKIGNAFDTSIPKLTARVDPKFATDMGQLVDMSKSMVPQKADQFASIIQNQVARKIAPTGVISGESLHEMQSTLGRLASDAYKSPAMDDRLLGDGLKQAQSNVLDLISRSNPAGAAEFNAARQAYKNFLPVQRAASSHGADEGVFSPAQLLGAVKANDRSFNHAAFARGNATGQDFAEAAKSVLGSKVPNSGTTDRWALIKLIAGLGGIGSVSPTAALGTALGAGTLGAAYSRPGQRALAALLASRPAVAPSVAQGLRRSGPLLNSLMPSLLSGGASP